MTPEFQVKASTIALRKFIPDDAEKLYQMSQEAGLREFIPSQVYRDLPHAKRVLAFLISQYHESANPRTCPLVFGVVLSSSGILIGHVGLSPFGETVEIGFAIEDSQKGKGYATVAAKAMCNWAMREYNLNKIHGFVAEPNEASKRVLLRAGFAFVGEKTMPFQGTVALVDIFEFSRAADDQRSHQAVQNIPSDKE